MRLTDTHTHIYLPEFDADRDDVMRRAAEAAVERMVMPGTNLASLPLMRAVKEKWPERVYMAAGLHPTDLGNDPMGEVAEIESEIALGGFIAVGEIGMDLYWDKSSVDEQMQVFERQMNFAVRNGLPVIIHCREALDQTLEVIEGLDEVPHGVFHSFSGTASDVDRIRRYGDFYFGLNGVATFKNCHVTEAVPEIGMTRLLLETDAPYLAPVPHRGKRNEPAYTALTCHHIAACTGMTADDVASATTKCAADLFNF